MKTRFYKQKGLIFPQRLSLTLAAILPLWFLCAIPCALHAQVTIGALEPPGEFSVLELNTSIVRGGLRLPQMEKPDRDGLTGGITADSAEEEETKGLLIMNMTVNGAKLCLNYWAGTATGWVDLCESNSKSAVSPGPKSSNAPQDGLELLVKTELELRRRRTGNLPPEGKPDSRLPDAGLHKNTIVN